MVRVRFKVRVRVRVSVRDSARVRIRVRVRVRVRARAMVRVRVRVRVRARVTCGAILLSQSALPRVSSISGSALSSAEHEGSSQPSPPSAVDEAWRLIALGV